jgi:hypothetical protein
MGLYGPLIVYQVLSNRKDTDAKNLRDLKEVAAEIQWWGDKLGEIGFGTDYKGNRTHLYCDESGDVKVHQESNKLFRPILLQLIEKTSVKKVAVIVNDIKSLLDCDVFISTALAYMNSRVAMQVFSLKNPQMDRSKPAQHLTKLRLNEATDGDAAYHMLMDNSQSCQAISSKLQIKNLKKMEENSSLKGIDWHGGVQAVVPKIMQQWKKIVVDPEIAAKPKKPEYIQF